MKKETKNIKESSVKERLSLFGVPNSLVDIIEKIGQIIDVEIVGDFCYLSLRPTFLEKIRNATETYSGLTEEKIKHKIVREFMESLPKEFSENFKKDLLENIYGYNLSQDYPTSLIIFKSKYKEFNPSDPNKPKSETTIFSVYSPLGLDVDEMGRPVRFE